MAPVAAVYLRLDQQARSPASGFRFYLASGLWPFAISSGFLLAESNHIWPPNGLAVLILLAPFVGATFDRQWRLYFDTRRPSALQSLAVTGSVLAIGAGIHILYLGTFDPSPTVSAESLVGKWSSLAGTTVVARTDLRGGPPDTVMVNKQPYRVVRSFWQLALAKGDDPDAMTIVYRKEE